MTPYDIQRRISQYKFSPGFFSEEDLDELKEHATHYGIPFDYGKDTRERRQKSSWVGSQLTSGFVEGVLGPLSFGGWAEEPETETQAIARSMGHLFGFALPLLGSVFTFGATGMARIGLGATSIARGTTAVGQALKSGTVAGATGKLAKVPIKSIPLLAGDVATKYGKELLAKSGWEAANYLKGPLATTTKGKLLDVAFQSGHLAVASGVSGIFNGKNDELNNFLFGAVAGGAFGGMGNFIRIGKLVNHGNPKIAEFGRKNLWLETDKLVKMGLGSVFQGGMSTAMGAPTSVQIYEYLLGGFFGYNSMGTVERQAHEYFNKFSDTKADGTGKKYEYKDYRDMLKTERFKQLPDESKQVVRDIWTRSIGEMWDAGTSEASAVLGFELKENYQSALDKVAERYNKKVKELKPHEIAEAKVDLLESVPKKYSGAIVTDSVVDALRRGIAENKMDEFGPETKEIIAKLTPKEIEEVKAGVVDPLERAVTEYFERRAEEVTSVTAEDISKATEKVSSDQAETYATPMLKRFLNSLQEQVDKTGYDPREVFKFAVDIFKDVKTPTEEKPIKGTDKTKKEYGLLDVDFYIGILKNKFPELEITEEMHGGLKQLFIRLAQNELRPLVSYNVNKSKVGYVSGLNAFLKRIISREPRSADEKMYRLEGQWGDNVQVWEFGEVVKGKGEFKPYEVIFNPDTKKWEPVLNSKSWISVHKHLWGTDKQDRLHKKGQYYLKIPKKDTGVERLYRFHDKTFETPLDDIINEIVVKDGVTKKKLEDFLKMGQRIWLETMGADPNDLFLNNLYMQSFKSNYLYEKNWNFKDAVARVKRESLLSSKSFYEQDPKNYKTLTGGTDKVKVYIIDAESGLLGNVAKKVKKFLNVKGRQPETYNRIDEKGNIVKEAWESKIDGYIVMHSEMYKQFLKHNGLDVSTSHMKPVVAVKIGDGIFMIKAGIHPPRKGFDDVLKDHNSMIVMTSSAKSLPEGLKPYRGQADKNGKYTIIDNRGPSLEINISDLRINQGVYGDKHSSMRTSIKKQMHSLFDRLVMSPRGYTGFMDAIHQKILHGTPEGNQYVKDVVKDSSVLPPKNFEVGHIKYTDLIDIINNPAHPLNELVMKDIFKKIKNMEVDEELGKTSEIEELKEYANNFEQWYAETKSPVAAVLNPLIYEKIVQTYLLKKFTHPEWDYSATGWVAGVDPIMEAITGGISANKRYKFMQDGKLKGKKVGHFKLGHSHKKMKINWGADEVITLEEGYNRYLKELKSATGTPESIAKMRGRLLMAVMRVPASAISGTRGLLFDGFVGNDVKMEDWGVYMRGRDHFYIDGADVDGDKVFFYQGLPDSYMHDIIKNDAQFEFKYKGKTVFAENKSKKFDPLFKSELSNEKGPEGISEKEYVENNPISMFDPGALRKAGASSYQGKKGLGQIVNAKSLLNTVISDIIFNKKGVLDMEVRNNKGNVIGKLLGKTSKGYLKKPDGYYVIGTEASSRTADSSSYYRMASPSEMIDIILKSAFDNLRFVPNKGWKGEIPEPSMWMIKKSREYEPIVRLNEVLYGRNYEKGRAWTLNETKDVLREYGEPQEFMNSIVDIASKMSIKEVNTDPLRLFDFKTVDKAVKLISDTIFKDPDVLQLIARKNLTVTPWYWHVNHEKVLKAMELHPEYRTQKGNELSRDTMRFFVMDGLTTGSFESRFPETGKDIRKTFNRLFDYDYHSGKPITRVDPSVERDYRINDTYDLFSGIRILEKGTRLREAMETAGHDVVTTGANIPWSEIQNIAFKISQNPDYKPTTQKEVSIFTKWKKHIYNEAKAMRGEAQFGGKFENAFIVFRDYISERSRGIKIAFRQEMNSEESQPVYKTTEQINKKIDQDVVDITEMAKGYNIDPKVAVDYYYNYLLSSLRPQHYHTETVLREMNNALATAEKNGQTNLVELRRGEIENFKKYYNKTGISRFTWSATSIPSNVKKEFMMGYAKMFDLLNKPVTEPHKELSKDVVLRESNKMDVGEPVTAIENTELKNLHIDRLFEVVDQEIVDPIDKTRLTRPTDIPSDIENKVMPSIKQSLKKLPDGAILRFEDLYAFMKSEQGFTGETSIRKATWDDIRNFDRFLLGIINMSAKDNILTKWKSTMFPQTVGERMAGHDLSVLMNMKIPTKNIDGSMGLATIKVPISTMSFLQTAGNAVRRVEDATKNLMLENLFSGISVRGELESIHDGVNIFNELFSTAIGLQNKQRSVKSKQKEFYEQEWNEKFRPLWDKHKNEIYIITRDGKRVERTGEELITDILDQTTKYFGETMFETWIGAGSVNKNGVWERIDWGRIDDNFEFEGKGLFIHDLVRYNKHGRFDIENFKKKVLDPASEEGNVAFQKLLFSKDNPLSVELLNRVQYETALEELIIERGLKPNSLGAKQYRKAHRKRMLKGDKVGEEVWNKTAFVGIGRVGESDPTGRFETEYFPQMLHDKKKVMPWINEQQASLKEDLNNYFRELLRDGKLSGKPYNIPNRYKPSRYEIDAVLGRIKGVEMSDKEVIINKMALQRNDLESFLGTRIEGSDSNAELGVTYVNARFREPKDWNDLNLTSRPGTGRQRSDTPMPFFSYSFDVVEAYTNQWISSFFRNVNSLLVRDKIIKYEKNNPIPEEVKEPWIRHMQGFANTIMNHPHVLPKDAIGLSKVEISEMAWYIKQNKDNPDDKIQRQIGVYKQNLQHDAEFKKRYKANSLGFLISDHNIVDWLDAKSQKLWGGTKDRPKFPFLGELPANEPARKKVLYQTLNNAGTFEAKWSLISLLAHPKTAIGNILGGSQNTISSAGFRNFKRAWDTKWLLSNVFAGATLKDGTPIKDRLTIHRWVAETGSLESFYVTEASLDKSLRVQKMLPAVRDALNLIRKDPSATDSDMSSIWRKHGVINAVVEAGGTFMRVSERKLRSDAFIAHYLQARETLSNFVPDLRFDNPYLIKMAVRGVEASQFLYHNVSRPEIASSVMGKVLTRFQPFMWNSIRFRKNIFKMAHRYGFEDEQSMGRLRRMAALDLFVTAMSNIFVGSIFDTTLPPPMNYLQASADWLFGDERERKRAFFSSYPHPALAPLQMVTGPIHRVYLPLITAMINGEWESYVNFYIPSLFPFGRIGRSLVQSWDKPEMIFEYWGGIPVHAVGRKLRKWREGQEVANGE